MITILNATYSGDYKIKFEFSESKKTDIDFYPFLSIPSQNDCIKKYLDTELFKTFEIINKRDISWNFYEMCFRFEEIYTGTIEPTILLYTPCVVCEPEPFYVKKFL